MSVEVEDVAEPVFGSVLELSREAEIRVTPARSHTPTVGDAGIITPTRGAKVNRLAVGSSTVCLLVPLSSVSCLPLVTRY